MKKLWVQKYIEKVYKQHLQGQHLRYLNLDKKSISDLQQRHPFQDQILVKPFLGVWVSHAMEQPSWVTILVLHAGWLTTTMIWGGEYGGVWLNIETAGDSGSNWSRGGTISWMDRSTSSSKFSTRIESLMYEGTFLEAGLLGSVGINFSPPIFLT